MNRLTELSISVVLLFSALYIECTPESIKIIRTDIKTKSWLIGLLAITIFCLTVALYERHDKEHKERLIESLKVPSDSLANTGTKLILSSSRKKTGNMVINYEL